MFKRLFLGLALAMLAGCATNPYGILGLSQGFNAGVMRYGAVVAPQPYWAPVTPPPPVIPAPPLVVVQPYGAPVVSPPVVIPPSPYYCAAYPVC